MRHLRASWSLTLKIDLLCQRISVFQIELSRPRGDDGRARHRSGAHDYSALGAAANAQDHDLLVEVPTFKELFDRHESRHRSIVPEPVSRFAPEPARVSWCANSAPYPGIIGRGRPSSSSTS